MPRHFTSRNQRRNVKPRAPRTSKSLMCMIWQQWYAWWGWWWQQYVKSHAEFHICLQSWQKLLFHIRLKPFSDFSSEELGSFYNHSGCITFWCIWKKGNTITAILVWCGCQNSISECVHRRVTKWNNQEGLHQWNTIKKTEELSAPTRPNGDQDLGCNLDISMND